MKHPQQTRCERVPHCSTIIPYAIQIEMLLQYCFCRRKLVNDTTTLEGWGLLGYY